MCESEQTRGRSIIAVSVLSDELEVRPVLPDTGLTHFTTRPVASSQVAIQISRDSKRKTAPLAEFMR